MRLIKELNGSVSCLNKYKTHNSRVAVAHPKEEIDG
jgi:hypothetical protein